MSSENTQIDFDRPEHTAGRRFDVSSSGEYWKISEAWSKFDEGFEKDCVMVVAYDEGDCDTVRSKYLLFRWIYDAMQMGDLLKGDTIYLDGKLIARIPVSGVEPEYLEPWPEKPKLEGSCDSNL